MRAIKIIVFGVVTITFLTVSCFIYAITQIEECTSGSTDICYEEVSTGQKIIKNLLVGKKYRIYLKKIINGITIDIGSYIIDMTSSKECRDRMESAPDTTLTCCSDLEPKSNIIDIGGITSTIFTCCKINECADNGRCIVNNGKIPAENKKCVNGSWEEIVPAGDPKCQDVLDGGRDYAVKGYLEWPLYETSYEEKCLNSKELLEYWCDGDMMAREVKDCEYGCANGVCETPACPDSYCDIAGGECSTCSADCSAEPGCCGNNVCDQVIGENYSTCLADCPCRDADGDGFDNCAIGETSDDGRKIDCDDSNSNINPSISEICDGIDNNCDSFIDNNLVVPNNDNQNGVCLGSQKTCAGTTGWQNDYSSVLYNEYPTETSCDGRDNNCDGTIDEGCGCVDGSTQVCGSDIGECNTGTQICSEGSWGICSGEVTPVAEICDGIDNNCNGTVDDGLVRPDNDNQNGVCLGSQKTCAGTTGWQNDYTATNISNYENIESNCSDNLDNDCDGSVDGDDDNCPETINPTVNSFYAVVNASNVDIDWNVSDAGGSHLDRVEIWRASDSGGSPGTWGEVGILRQTITSQNLDNYTAAISDSPGNATWWYGLHVIDQDCNIGTEASPISVVINTAPTCSPDGCNGNCPANCTVADDLDCGSTGCDGDGVCNAGECAISSSDCSLTDCCSNEVCDNGENSSSCPDDCPAAMSGNKKLLSKYNSSQIFLIADDNWQEVLSLVSLTTWTAQDANEYASCQHPYHGASDVCSYPTLIYHKEAADIYDADSILYFIDQYSSNDVIAINDLPTELAGHINGKGVVPSVISAADYLSYWDNYDEVVYAQNNYQLALLASTFASLKNAPLIIAGTSNDTTGTFTDKKVYTVGSASCPASAASCDNFNNLDSLEVEYLNITNTDKMVLVNYNDLNLSLAGQTLTPYFSSNAISKVYNRLSVTSPFLASAKHELILSTSATSYINVDSFIESKLSSLSFDPKYLTIIAYPEAIQMSQLNLQPRPENPLYNEVDNSIYADSDHNDYPDMAVGRIFSNSVADVSTNICRSLFYNRITQSNNFSSIWPNYFQSQKIEAKSNDVLLSAAGLNEESVYYDEGYSSMDLHRDLEDKFFINYQDHAYQLGFHDTVYSTSMLSNNIRMHPSVVVTDACLTCAYELSSAYQQNNLLCSRFLRQGALSYLGTVDTIYVGTSDSLSKMFIEGFLDGGTLGDALKRIKVENVLRRNRPSNNWTNELALVLLGDPTFYIYPIYPTIDKTQVTENVDDKRVIFDIPEVQNTFESDVLWPSTRNDILAYFPPLGKEVSKYVTTWDPANTSSPYAQGEYFIEIDNNYVISDISDFTLIMDSGVEVPIVSVYHPTLSYTVYQTVSLNSLININSLNIRVETDAPNNKTYVRIMESYRFATPYSNSFGSAIPAHSYRMTFN